MILKETKYSEIGVTNNIYKNLYYLHELEIKYNLLNNPQFKKYWYIDPEQGEEKYYHAQERKQVINPKLRKQVNDISKWLLSYYYIVLQSWYQSHNFQDKEYPLICQVSRGNVKYKQSDVEDDQQFQYTEQLTIEQQKGRLSDILIEFDNHFQTNDIVLFTLLHLMIIGGANFIYSARYMQGQYDNQVRKQIQYLINLYLKISDKQYEILADLLDIISEFQENIDENIIIKIYNDSTINPEIHEILQKLQNISKIADKNKLMKMIEYIVIQNIYNENPISQVFDSEELSQITEMQIIAKDKLLPGDQKKKDKLFYNYIEKYLSPIRKERMKQLRGSGSKFLKTNLEKAKKTIDLCYKTLKILDSIPETEKMYKLMVIMNRIEGLVHSNGDILDYMSPSDLYITDISLDYPYEGVEQYLYPDMFNIMVDQIDQSDFYDYFKEIDDISKFFKIEDEQDFNEEIGQFSNFGQYLSFLSKLDKKQPKIFNDWIDDLVSYGISPDIKTYMQVK